ncbi:zinc-binding dehydrogenase [Streptomyces sp. NBC_01016]|uniref:zinc-binding dehydrogenase n=1 Tax=Streptomyces sp. NBC_01016 TaxID=2903720 RepID=UPI0022503211|nr:zinc-binding dehydrogenase [Streptomyces sp. NBC_01016]MCX4834561.1 zinc-binding dehydrogenase [Streptomyces sp. NBC_01016]
MQQKYCKYWHLVLQIATLRRSVGRIARTKPSATDRPDGTARTVAMPGDLAKSLGAEMVASLEDEGTFDVLMECTGVQQVRHDGCLYVRPGGRAVFIGVGHQDAGVPMPAVIESEVEIRGVMRYRFTWPTVIAGLRDGRFQADDLVTRTLPLEEAHLAWTQAPQGPDVKTIIRVGTQP